MILSCFVVFLNFKTRVIFVGHGLWVFMPSLLFVCTFCEKCLIHIMRLYLCFSRLFEFQMLMLQLNYSQRFEFFGILSEAVLMVPKIYVLSKIKENIN